MLCAPGFVSALIKPCVFRLARTALAVKGVPATASAAAAAAATSELDEFAHACPLGAGCNLPILDRSGAHSE